MRTRTRHTHPLTLAVVLVALTRPAAAADYEPADFLPLAVGNSWTIGHEVYDLYGGVFPDDNPGEMGHVTITVERTEVFGDTTYYVLSDLPPGWAPAPLKSRMRDMTHRDVGTDHLPLTRDKVQARRTDPCPRARNA